MAGVKAPLFVAHPCGCAQTCSRKREGRTAAHPESEAGVYTAVWRSDMWGILRDALRPTTKGLVGCGVGPVRRCSLPCRIVEAIPASFACPREARGCNCNALQRDIVTVVYPSRCIRPSMPVLSACDMIRLNGETIQTSARSIDETAAHGMTGREDHQ